MTQIRPPRAPLNRGPLPKSFRPAADVRRATSGPSAWHRAIALALEAWNSGDQITVAVPPDVTNTEVEQIVEELLNAGYKVHREKRSTGAGNTAGEHDAFVDRLVIAA